MSEISDQNDLAELSFEAALAELEGVVAKLESGQVPLDESIALYERGQRLKAHCDARLAAAQAKIEQISLGADGQPQGVTSFGADG